MDSLDPSTMMTALKDTTFRLRNGKKKIVFKVFTGILFTSTSVAFIINGIQHNNYIMLGLGIGLAGASALGFYHINDEIDVMFNDATKDVFANAA